jgi:hypothetical protein
MRTTIKKAQLVGFLKSLIELTDLTFDLSSIYPFCKTTESEAARLLNRFSIPLSLFHNKS